MKLKGHLDTQNRTNLLFYQDNRTLNHTEIVQQASHIMQKLRGFMEKRASSTADNVSRETSGAEPVDNSGQTSDNIIEIEPEKGEESDVSYLEEKR